MGRYGNGENWTKVRGRGPTGCSTDALGRPPDDLLTGRDRLLLLVAGGALHAGDHVHRLAVVREEVLIRGHGLGRVLHLHLKAKRVKN